MSQANRYFWALSVLLAAALFKLWILPLRSSFWVDEMVTAFVVHYGSAHPSLSVGPQAAGLRSLLKSRDWNEVNIIARGNTISQMFNGNAMSILIDDDAAHWAASGLIGIALRGESAKLEIRNIRLKKLP